MIPKIILIGILQKKLKNEDYQQLSLSEKLKYITTEIAQTENVINTLGIEVLAQDIEIKILADEIEIKENDISLLNQEINILEQTVNERVTQSYKFSHDSPFEYLFDVKNLDSILRKVKYLIETRINDKNSLNQYSVKMDSLEDEELILASKKAELQKKRNELEEEKERLVEEKAYLDQQQIEKNNLLAESKRREEAYRKELAETTAMISEMDEKISAIVSYF